MSLFELLEKIVGTEAGEVEIELPEDEPKAHQPGAGKINLLSLQILKREAERRGKRLKLKAAGPRAKHLIAQLEESSAGGGLGAEPVKVAGRRFRIKQVGLIPLIILGIFLLLGAGAYWAIGFFPRAEIILTLRPVPLVKELEVSVDTGVTEVDVAGNVIPGVTTTVEVEGQKVVSATGTAMVGEKATGEVRFVNGNATEVHISAGDKVVETGQGLVFIVVMAVDVPATSSATTVGVTAEQIGGAYNLDPNKFFTVEGKEGISARNDVAFTGGESHQVTIVSSADQAKVLEELQGELAEEGREELRGQVSSGWLIVQEAIEEEELERHFLQEIGDQADEAGLVLKMKFTTVVYKEDDLESFVSGAVADLIPDGYELYPGEMGIEILNPEFSNSALKFSPKISAQVIPRIDLEGVRNNLAGCNVAGAREYLASLSNITAYELHLWPDLPERLRRVPKRTDRIKIELRAEE